MGSTITNLLVHPNTQFKFQQLHTDFGVSLIVASVQGWREHMEDYFCIHQLDNQKIVAGVFDGHGGPQIACYVSRKLQVELCNQKYFKQNNYSLALQTTFNKIDEMIISNEGQQELKRIYKELTKSQIQQGQIISQSVGSTANVLLLTKDRIYIANLGDSRSVLCRNGKAIDLSQDHKPNNQDQKARIIKAGGYINHNRINGNINISRTFGDFYFKSNKNKKKNEQMIISTPEIKQMERDFKQDQYIVIASDGVWQKYGRDTQSMINSLNQYIVRTNTWKEALKQFILSLIPKSVSSQQTGYDNMTIILILMNESRTSQTFYSHDS